MFIASKVFLSVKKEKKRKDSFLKKGSFDHKCFCNSFLKILSSYV